MRIVFWGSERECCVTSNMLILATYFALQRGFRICLVELAEEKKGIDSKFSERKRCRRSTRMETLFLQRLYLVRKEACRDTEHLFDLERNMDMVFLNLANRTDEKARELMHNADLVVVNLKQEWRSFDEFYARYANLSARIFLLIGRYYDGGSCDKEQIRRKYDIEETQLGVIPNNPEYEIACSKGQISRYMKKNNPGSMSAIKSMFFKEVERTAEVIYERLQL